MGCRLLRVWYWCRFGLVASDSWFWFVMCDLCRIYVVWWCSLYLDLGFLVFWVVWIGVWLLILFVGGMGCLLCFFGGAFIGTLLRSLLRLFGLFTVVCIFVVWVLHFAYWWFCSDSLRLVYCGVGLVWLFVVGLSRD